MRCERVALDVYPHRRRTLPRPLCCDSSPGWPPDRAAATGLLSRYVASRLLGWPAPSCSADWPVREEFLRGRSDRARHPAVASRGPRPWDPDDLYRAGAARLSPQAASGAVAGRPPHDSAHHRPLASTVRKATARTATQEGDHNTVKRRRASRGGLVKLADQNI